MPDAQPRSEVSESLTPIGSVSDSRTEPPQLVPPMRRGEPDEALTARVYATIEESRRFLAQRRAARSRPAPEPDEVQARIMRRGGRPSMEHYQRVFQIEGMSAEQARAEARRMVEADAELLARYPAA